MHNQIIKFQEPFSLTYWTLEIVEPFLNGGNIRVSTNSKDGYWYYDVQRFHQNEDGSIRYKDYPKFNISEECKKYFNQMLKMKSFW